MHFQPSAGSSHECSDRRAFRVLRRIRLELMTRYTLYAASKSGQIRSTDLPIKHGLGEYSQSRTSLET
jgi:hypothetical protein